MTGRILIKNLALVSGVILFYLVVFDVVAVAASFVFDVAPLRYKSIGLFYTIWFVAGVFCGFICYDTGGGILSVDSKDNWLNHADARKSGLLVVACMSFVLLTLSLLSYVYLWRGTSNSSYYVPDNPTLTVTFFITVLASTVLAHRLLRPDPRKRA